MPSDLRGALGGRLIGCHLPLGHGMVKAAERGQAIGAAALQVFADNPTAWRRREAPPAELPAFRARLEELGLGPTAIHAAYLINLAGADESFWERSIEALAAELRMGAAYGAAFVNVHVGSHRGAGSEVGVQRLAAGLARTLAAVGPQPGGPRLVLENSAGGGDGIGSQVEQLASVLEAAERAGADPARLAICLDTAHLWGAGYEISHPHVLDALLERFDALLGPERLAMIHLNDSKAPLGSHADRHQHIGAGEIGVEGMRHLVTHERLAAVPAYLETPGMEEGYDALNMERVRLLIAGEPLPSLAPEDLELRGSRSHAEHAHPAAPASA
jgi:deoxyribonuclease-4